MFRACALLLTFGIAAPLAAQTSKPAQPRTSAAKKPVKPATPPPSRPAPTPEPPPRVPPDLIVTTTHATGDVRTTSTVQLKGARARVSVGENLASIQQCDARQVVQLNTQTRTYLTAPFAAEDAATHPGDSKRKGGQVVYTTTVTDTGERQTMFGFNARHLKSIVSRDASPTACDRKPQRIETDGWYIELPETISCATVPQPAVTIQVDPQHSDCADEIRYERPSITLGYPVKYTSLSTTGDDAAVTTTMEVTRLERVDVDQALVEVPADYVGVRTVAQLTADHRPGEASTKKPGTMRVGLMPVSNRSTAAVETASLDRALLDAFGDTDLDIVRLTGSSPAELEADARAKDVDLLLNSSIAEVKVPRGGLVGRVSGSSGEAFAAKIDYTLVAPGQAKPVHSGSERSGGGSALNSAINIAKKVVQFAPPLMMAKYGYMNAYGQMLSAGAPPGAMRQSPDPVMNMAFSLLDRATAPLVPPQFGTEEAAVLAALEKISRSVASDVSKKGK